ncbi:MAG: phosphoribosylanthranilate isomerase [Lachnospiraceae bacterium]|nr:phosphoribosylanthranilate isomerase [Lachnospiraceae bacterium]
MTGIKLCGLTRQEDIDYVNRLLPDYIGFVFFEKSRRNVMFETAKTLKMRLDPRIKAVGVFVDADISFIGKLARAGVIDLVQLHGNEDEAYIASLRKETQVPLIKAFKVESADDIARANASSADYVLLDSGMGSGRPFDWTMIAGMRRDFFLAGGISPDNAAEAIARCRPFAVDVSTMIETDGVKDYEKMKAFAMAVRGSRL